MLTTMSGFRLIRIAGHQKGSEAREAVQLRWQLCSVQLRGALSCAERLVALLRYFGDTVFYVSRRAVLDFVNTGSSDCGLIVQHFRYRHNQIIPIL